MGSDRASTADSMLSSLIPIDRGVAVQLLQNHLAPRFSKLERSLVKDTGSLWQFAQNQFPQQSQDRTSLSVGESHELHLVDISN